VEKVAKQQCCRPFQYLKPIGGVMALDYKGKEVFAYLFGHAPIAALNQFPQWS